MNTLTRVKLQKNERNAETHLSHKGFLATVTFFESADPFTACKNNVFYWLP
jgi:hypothetical protein